MYATASIQFTKLNLACFENQSMHDYYKDDSPILQRVVLAITATLSTALALPFVHVI